MLYLPELLLPIIKTSATYCNGPITNGDTTNCPSFGFWGNVRLKFLKSITIPSSREDSQNLRIEDNDGNIWEMDLSTCKSNYNSIRGCIAQVDYSNLKKLHFSIEVWDISSPSKRIALFLEDQNSLSILAPGGDQLVFNLH